MLWKFHFLKWKKFSRVSFPRNIRKAFFWEKNKKFFWGLCFLKHRKFSWCGFLLFLKLWQKSAGFHFWKYEKCFLLIKYRKSFSLRKYNIFFNTKARKFFPKISGVFLGKNFFGFFELGLESVSRCPKNHITVYTTNNNYNELLNELNQTDHHIQRKCIAMPYIYVICHSKPTIYSMPSYPMPF